MSPVHSLIQHQEQTSHTHLSARNSNQQLIASYLIQLKVICFTFDWK